MDDLSASSISLSPSTAELGKSSEELDRKNNETFIPPRRPGTPTPVDDQNIIRLNYLTECKNQTSQNTPLLGMIENLNDEIPISTTRFSRYRAIRHNLSRLNGNSAVFTPNQENITSFGPSTPLDRRSAENNNNSASLSLAVSLASEFNSTNNYTSTNFDRNTPTSNSTSVAPSNFIGPSSRVSLRLRNPSLINSTIQSTAKSLQNSSSPLSKNPSNSQKIHSTPSIPESSLSNFFVRIILHLQVVASCITFMCIIVNQKTETRVGNRSVYAGYHDFIFNSGFLLSMENWVKVSIPWFIYPIFVAIPNHLDAFLQYFVPEWSFKNLFLSNNNTVTCLSKFSDWSERTVERREIIDRAVQFFRMVCFFSCWILALVKSYQTRDQAWNVYSEPLKDSGKNGNESDSVEDILPDL